MVKAVQAGQVWRNDANGDNFLITKVYAELFTQYAMLRPATVSAPKRGDDPGESFQDGSRYDFARLYFTQASQDF